MVPPRTSPRIICSCRPPRTSRRQEVGTFRRQDVRPRRKGIFRRPAGGYSEGRVHSKREALLEVEEPSLIMGPSPRAVLVSIIAENQ